MTNLGASSNPPSQVVYPNARPAKGTKYARRERERRFLLATKPKGTTRPGSMGREVGEKLRGSLGASRWPDDLTEDEIRAFKEGRASEAEIESRNE